MKNDDKQQFEQEVKRKVQISPTLPVNGCLWVVIVV